MKILTLTLVSCAALASTSYIRREPLFIWNVSASAPIGLYAVSQIDKLIVTDLVVAQPPDPLGDWLAAHGYLPRNIPLIKRVAGLPGQKICRDGLIVSIDGIAMAETREKDHAGRPLPIWRGCFVLRPGEVFLLNWEEPASLDGRYFGAFLIDRLIGHAMPLWMAEDD
jgi:conjugative transfer signal peptidase TraF